MKIRARKPISMVLITDDSSVWEGVVPRIRAQPGFRVVAASAESSAALHQVRESKPDLVLLLLRCGGDNSLTLAGALHGARPASRVIIIEVGPLHEDLARLIRAGVSGFLMVNASFDQFQTTIQSVARGIQVLPAELTHALFAQLIGRRARRRPKRNADGTLPGARECAVAELMVQGWSTAAIATRTGIGLHSVRSHVHRVLSKLAVNRHLEVAALSA